MSAADVLPRLAIVGTGRMGRAVRALADDRSWPVTLELGRDDNPGGRALTAEQLREVDVVIEFTAPASAVDNAIACARAGVPVVIGTTGWRDRLEQVAQVVREEDAALFWAANFSPAVNVFWRVAAEAARQMAALPGFAAHIVETHHAGKLDAPSGTALELQQRAARAWGRPVPTTSLRVGHVPGTHTLLFDGPFEQLRVEHEARDRRVFADGALLAARWLASAWQQGRRGVFTMDDLLDDDSDEPPTSPMRTHHDR